MQRVKDNIWEKGDMEGQRGLIKIQIKDSVVQFTNSVHSKQCFLKNDIFHLSLYFLHLSEQDSGRKIRLQLMIKKKKIQNCCTYSRVKDSYLILQFRWNVTVIRKPYFKKIGKKVEQNDPDSFLCYLKLLNLSQISYHGEFLCLQF